MRPIILPVSSVWQRLIQFRKEVSIKENSIHEEGSEI